MWQGFIKAWLHSDLNLHIPIECFVTTRQKEVTREKYFYPREIVSKISPVTSSRKLK